MSNEDENNLMSDLFGDDNDDDNDNINVKSEVNQNNIDNDNNNNTIDNNEENDQVNNANSNEGDDNDKNNEGDDNDIEVDMVELFGDDDDDEEDEEEEDQEEDGGVIDSIEDNENITVKDEDDIMVKEEEETIRKISIESAKGEPYNMLEDPIQKPNILESENPQVLNILLPNSIGLDTEPYERDTYEPPILDPKTNRDKYGRSEADMWNIDSVIRWRIVADEDGNYMRQSNAKVVRWSDGSLQLIIGKIAYDLNINALPKQTEHYLIASIGRFNYVNKMMYRIMIPITGTAICKPANMRDSKLAKKYERLNMKRKFQTPKLKKTSEAAAVFDKEQLKVEERMMDAKDRRRRARESRNVRKDRQAVSANFLEAGIDDDVSASEEEYQRPFDSSRLLQAQQQSENNYTKAKIEDDKNNDDDNENDDDDDEDDEMEMKQKRAGKRRRVALIDDDDE